MALPFDRRPVPDLLVYAASAMSTIRCFPPEDQAFEYLAETLAQELRSDGIPDAEAPRHLERRLRAVYPRARVHVRDSLANIGYDGCIWYVYRSGHFEAGSEDDRWWETPGLPRLELDAHGRYVGANDAALELIGVSIEELRGAQVGDFSDPDVRRYLHGVRRLANGTPVDSEAVLVTKAGGRLHVQFHLTKDPQTDRRAAVLRPLERLDEPEVSVSPPAG